MLYMMLLYRPATTIFTAFLFGLIVATVILGHMPGDYSGP